MHEIITHQYNLKNNTDTTNRHGKEVLREVDEFVLHDGGLYVAMPLPNSVNVSYIKSNVIPKLGITITKFTFKSTKIQDSFGAYDYYFDIIDVGIDNDIWIVKDLYLDLLLWDKKKLRILDTDEFSEAQSLDYIGSQDSTKALENLHNIINNLSLFNYDIDAYLKSINIELLWK